ncbi:MAG TPA: trehalose-phosphatase [Candidatus Dormibacteraeota bacterium]|nr:trehalose-phosphatase [Candidatus Dormibacteraeota bacterium]
MSDRLAILEDVRPRAVLLASDFDGTLAEIRDRPEAVRAHPRSLQALSRLRLRLGRITIISGRATTMLRALLPMPGLRLLGDYGLGRPTPAERAALDELARQLAPHLRSLPGVWLERKPGSASVHFRAAPTAGTRLEAVVRTLAEPLGLRVRAGRMVVEVMPARADKATALRSEIESMRPGAVIFGGDDTGDRGCFELVAALDRPHLAVGVESGEAAPGLFEACDLVVPGPTGFANLLEELAAWAER